MKSTQMDHLRAVVQGLSRNGELALSNALVYRALDVECDAERAVVRRQLNEMVRRHELERTGRGEYRYNSKARPGRSAPGYQRMWRAIRASKGTFSYSEIAAVSHVEISFVNRYCRFLLTENCIRKNGKDGTRLLFSLTAQGRETRSTPYPPRRIAPPFEAERKAMSRMARVFFEDDLYGAKARGVIAKECRTILARFGGEIEGGDNGRNESKDG